MINGWTPPFRGAITVDVFALPKESVRLSSAAQAGDILLTKSSPADDLSNVQRHRSPSTKTKENKFSLYSQSLLTFFLFFVPYFGATGTPPCTTWCDQQWFLQKPFSHSKQLNVVFLFTKFTRLHQIHCICFPPFRISCM